MKRSDFLKQLYIDVDVAIDSGTNENMVDLIIRRAEELGMLAPLSEFEESHPQCDIHGPISNRLINVKRHKWEEEE